jgi:flavin reductase (DIM6/NTAB) family NADH-FMN oxidoreductase RutF
LFGTRTGDEVDKFARCSWRPGPAGVPVLDDCPRRFVGAVLDRVPLGNHTGFLLSPEGAVGDPAGRPLMFSDVRDLEAGHAA